MARDAREAPALPALDGGPQSVLETHTHPAKGEPFPTLSSRIGALLRGTFKCACLNVSSIGPVFGGPWGVGRTASVSA